MNLEELIYKINDLKKSIVLINLDQKDLRSMLDGANFIDLVEMYNKVGIETLYFDYIYPLYIDNRQARFIINGSFEDFEKKLMAHVDKEVGYENLAEKILWHLLHSTYFINLDKIYTFTETFLTPIEKLLATALSEANIQYTPQKKVGNYILDFFMILNGQKLAIECDGVDYHNPEADKERDRVMLQQHGIRTIRFTGSQIYNNAKNCVLEIFEHIKKQRLNQIPINNLPSDDYDIKQKQAIDHILGPCIVLAPAGSGKTTVLIERIISLIKIGVKPEGILAITFTKKAQEEMQNRLNTYIGDISKKMDIRTYHSLAHKYVSNNRNLMQGNMEWKVLKSMIEIDSKYKRLNSNLIKSVIKKIMNLEIITEDDQALYNDYSTALTNNNFFTFDILLIEFMYNLKRDKSFRKELQSRYEFILVDECQDNNKTEQVILKILAAPQDNLFLVGDDDQCIYTFAGSSIDNIINISHDYKNIKQIYLEYNYRCDPKIVETATNVIVSNNKRKLKIIKADPKKKAKLKSVEYYTFKTIAEEAKYIANFCLKDASGKNKVAVLYRNKYYVQNMINELKRLKVPFYIRDQFDLFQVKIVGIVHSYLVSLLGFAKEDHWKIVLKHGMPYISNEQVNSIVRSSNKVTAINLLISKLPYTEKFKVEKWIKFIPNFNEMKESIQGYTTIYEKSMYINTSLNLLNNDVENDQKDAFNIYLNIVKECKNIDELENNILGVQVNNNDTEEKFNVLLFTIHSSKGKQFDNVFLIGLTEGILPSYRSSSLEEQEEERRICYVGMTRAINKLFIVNALDKGNPSRFIDESKEPKMDCKTCIKSLPKKEENLCNKCTEYYCPEHLNHCHSCGASICIQCGNECSCGDVICDNCKSYCNVCKQPICPSDKKICTICKSTSCSEHSSLCNHCKKPVCEEHSSKCTKCNKVYCSNDIKVCELCGANECVDCHKEIVCECCGYSYCESYIDNKTKKCKACMNIKTILVEDLKKFVNDIKIFEGNQKVTIGIADKYIVYFKKKFFGLFNDKPIRIKLKNR